MYVAKAASREEAAIQKRRAAEPSATAAAEGEVDDICLWWLVGLVRVTPNQQEGNEKKDLVVGFGRSAGSGRRRQSRRIRLVLAAD